MVEGKDYSISIKRRVLKSDLVAELTNCDKLHTSLVILNGAKTTAIKHFIETYF